MLFPRFCRALDFAERPWWDMHTSYVGVCNFVLHISSRRGSDELDIGHNPLLQTKLGLLDLRDLRVSLDPLALFQLQCAMSNESDSNRRGSWIWYYSLVGTESDSNGFTCVCISASAYST